MLREAAPALVLCVDDARGPSAEVTSRVAFRVSPGGATLDARLEGLGNALVDACASSQLDVLRFRERPGEPSVLVFANVAVSSAGARFEQVVFSSGAAMSAIETQIDELERRMLSVPW